MEVSRKAFISSKYCHDLIAETPCYTNISILKFLTVLSTDYTNQTCINTYTLILEKDFQIGEREKSISYTKIICA